MAQNRQEDCRRRSGECPEQGPRDDSSLIAWRKATRKGEELWGEPSPLRRRRLPSPLSSGRPPARHHRRRAERRQASLRGADGRLGRGRRPPVAVPRHPALVHGLPHRRRLCRGSRRSCRDLARSEPPDHGSGLPGGGEEERGKPGALQRVPEVEGYPCQSEVDGRPETHLRYDPAAFFLHDLGVVVLAKPRKMATFGAFPLWAGSTAWSGKPLSPPSATPRRQRSRTQPRGRRSPRARAWSPIPS